MNIDEQIKLVDELKSLLVEKSGCLKKYREYIKDLAEEKSPSTFFQGSCSHCDDLDKKIVKIKTKLVA